MFHNEVVVHAEAKPEIEIAKAIEEENPRREKRDSLREAEALESEVLGLQETPARRSEG